MTGREKQSSRHETYSKRTSRRTVLKTLGAGAFALSAVPRTLATQQVPFANELKLDLQEGFTGGVIPLSNPWHYKERFQQPLEGFEPPVWVVVFADNVPKHFDGGWDSQPPSGQPKRTFRIDNGNVIPTPPGEPTDDLYFVLKGCPEAKLKLVGEDSAGEHQILFGDQVVIENTSPDEGSAISIGQVVELPVACRIEVDIDIKPGSDPNAIELNSEGVIPVAILNTGDFDPQRVNVDSLRFGAPDVVNGGGGAHATQASFEDVDADGDTDLSLKFPTQDTGFDGDESHGKLVGETTDGTPLFGTDSVKIVGQ